MKTEYTHTELGRDVESFAGFYTPLKEVRLEHNGREILVVVGLATVESSCCASGSCRYAIVPGYIDSWQRRKNRDGLPLSEVETITDSEARRQIAKIIEESEGITNIDFW